MISRSGVSGPNLTPQLWAEATQALQNGAYGFSGYSIRHYCML
ncbi:hypothetical protein BN132_3338 [Cronobacter turicensis 564]|nr:hypothetical protein BN132_3338 [Cronobacter turicensis 564]